MKGRKLRVYLDNCCYNRPYDDQYEPRVFLETQAKILVQDMIRQREVVLISSSVLDYEIAQSPFEARKEAIKDFISDFSEEHIRTSDSNEFIETAKSII